jgi:N utilization substance protein B
MSARGSRHKARIAAMQALYEADSSTHEALKSLARIAREERLNEESRAFARERVEGVLARREDIDERIGRAAPAWPVEQLSPVDRNILRLAIHEMLGDNGAPVRAVINEAVELAKSFGSESSSRFVNGVLGTIERQGFAKEATTPPGRGGD